MGVKSQKNWWALYNKWKTWTDTSWLVLYNALHFEKMHKRFLKMWVSEQTFCITFFTLLISIDPILLRLEIILEVFMMALSVIKLKSLHANKNVKQITSHFYELLASSFSHFLTLDKSKVCNIDTLLFLGNSKL